MVRTTSIEAYNAIKNNGLLSHRRMQVYEVLFHHGPMTQNECHAVIVREFPSEVVAARTAGSRFAELERRGVIAPVPNGKRSCRVTGVVCMTWDVTGNLPKVLAREPSTKEIIAGLRRGLAYAVSVFEKEKRVDILAEIEQRVGDAIGMEPEIVEEEE